MFPAMAGSILSASTFGVPLLTYLRNRISCFKFPKEPFAWMPWFSWKGRLHQWGFVPNLPVCISGRSWQSGVSLFFLLKVFYSDSLWYIRFYRGICCSPYIYRLFFCSHSLFCFSNVWYGLPSAFRIPANIDIRFCMILHVFYFSYVVLVLTCFWHLIAGGFI